MINLRPITRMLSQLSQRRRWQSHEQQSNDKSRQQHTKCGDSAVSKEDKTVEGRNEIRLAARYGEVKTFPWMRDL